MATTNKKDDFIKIKISTSDKEQLQKIAESKNLSLSEFCRGKIFDDDTINNIQLPTNGNGNQAKEEKNDLTKCYFRLTPEELDVLKVLSEEMRISRDAVVKRLIANCELVIIEPSIDDYELNDFRARLIECQKTILYAFIEIRNKDIFANEDDPAIKLLRECSASIAAMQKDFEKVKNSINRIAERIMKKNRRIISHNKIKRKAMLKRRNELWDLYLKISQEQGNNAEQYEDDFYSILSNVKNVARFMQIAESLISQGMGENAELFLQKLTEWQKYYLQ